MTFTMLFLTFFQPVVALLAGFLALLLPRMLNVIVALYLIVIGMTGLWPHIGVGDVWPTLR